MKLFVGLGNPGSKYEKTRHNIGFMAIDAIARAHDFPAARSRFQSQIFEGRLGRVRATLLKPQTFMNLSGQSVGEAMRYFKLVPDDVVVFHDEIDLAPGRVKVKAGGGHAGHNGLRSLHDHIGADFVRVRIGVGRPAEKRLVTGYVLHDFAQVDWEWIEPLLEGVSDGAALLADDDAPGFMNKVTLKYRPTKPEKEPPAAKAAKAAESAAKNDSSGAAEAETPAAASAAAKDGDEPKSALARLVAHFSRK